VFFANKEMQDKKKKWKIQHFFCGTLVFLKTVVFTSFGGHFDIF
jgi:hypothetical protein